MVDGNESRVILTIDDESSIRGSIHALLEDYDYLVLEAENGRVGLEIYQQQHVDLILLDLRMPEIDGLQVLSHVREHSPDLPIVVISGTGHIDDVVEALRLGAWDYLLKPVDDMNLLLHAIDKCLERARLLQENKVTQQSLEENVALKTRELAILNKRLKAVVETTKKLLGGSDLPGAVRILLQEFGSHMESLGGSFYRVEDAGLRKIAGLNGGHAPAYIAFPLVENSIFSRVIEQQKPLLIEDVSQEQLVLSGFKAYQSNSCLVFPIAGRYGDLKALLSFHDKKLPPFTAQDVEIGSILSSYSGEILDHAEVTEALRKSEEHLVQAQKMEAIGTLAGGIAHDFNNILSAIVGYTDLSLIIEECDPKIRKNLEQVKRAGIRASDLVKQILAFSRTDSFEESAIELSPVIEEVTKLLRATMPASITIQRNIISGMGLVVINPTKIHQILMNLCTNAAHAMGSDDGVISINYSLAEASEVEYLAGGHGDVKFLKLSVGDTGHGIDKEIVGKIFDPYFTTKEQGAGTGLGLAVVHGIVKTCGGLIEVESALGEGSVFNIFFPCQLQVANGDLDNVVDEISHGSERILFVDDEDTLAELVIQMLQELGYEVIGLTSSEAALEMLMEKAHDFDLLITDQTMPFLSGLELAQHALGIRPELPVILYTGYSATVDEEAARKIGIKEFMMKPLSMAKLSKVVRQVLDGEQSTES